MSRKGKKFYAVAKGEKPGIYDKWYGPDGAEVQVQGYPQARYQSFSTQEDARKWLNEFSSASIPDSTTGKPLEPPPPKPVEKKQNTLQTVQQKPAFDKNSKKGSVIIYTDGGCKKNPGPGGYGVVLQSGSKHKELSGGYCRTTNNRMELLACIKGLEALKFPCQVTLYSDSQYVVNGITKGWAKRWRKKGWMRNKDSPAENADLWSQLLDLCDKHDVSFCWVKGHAGNPGNERCDRLATQAMKKEDQLLEDTPFVTGQTTLVSNPSSLF